MSEALNRLVQDARNGLGSAEVSRLDWDGVEKRLFARVEGLKRAEQAALAAPRSRSWWAATVGLAAGAALAIVALKAREPRSLDPAERAFALDEAGSILEVDDDGGALLNGRPAKAGATLRLGDVIEARGQVTVGRPGKLTFVVERGSRATVAHVQGSLVLALSQGAIEAQVVPVASGEALAVDIGPSRVAVHGTHLRVARAGDQVMVDLSEGVVAVGDAPRVGSTLGELVTAPAHAEFTATDARGTLRVTHDPSAVRAPAALGASAQLKPLPLPLLAPAAARKGEAGEANNEAPSTSAGSPRAEPHPAANPPAGATAAPTADPNAQFAVAAGVRACMSERLHIDDVTVVVSTTLYLQLQDDGSVRAARFDPPVAPDVNACAAQSIYRARFTHAGAVTIPISVKN
jgi:hypothetical protein